MNERKRTERGRKRCRRAQVAFLAAALLTPRICALSTVSTKQRVDRSVGSPPETNDLVVVEPQEAKKMEMPPWLERLEGYTKDDAMIHLDWLEYALLEENFSFDNVREILYAVREASRGDVARMVGMIDFLRLILQLKEPIGDMFVTKEVLVAGALHYGDCITARETGVYELVKGAIYGRQGNGKTPRALPYVEECHGDESSTTSSSIKVTSSSLMTALPRNHNAATDSYQEEYGDEVMRITRDAARVKRAEILSNAILGVGRIPSKAEPGRLRGLLLSVMDDWRALAIRAVACLYRLEGILHDCERGVAEYADLTQEVVTVTREALHVYAPLAQRLGMQRLKAKLEDRAFRIMYRRQYQAVSSLYQGKGEEMQSVSSNLSAHIEQVLRQNPGLMDQLQDLRVVSRVKEPYSLWKKLLKLRSRRLKPGAASFVGSITESSSTSSELSLLDVKDGIAVRIILTARKWSDDEPEETMRARERLLCYFVQHLLRNYWPAMDRRRVKDYIQSPKPNGYQSLHYTSSINNEGQTWPFEVQVRSDEMHRLAEYGVAAHWDYKLGNRKIELLSPSFEQEALPLPQVDTDDVSMRASEESYIDALVTAREDLVQQKVFVFFAGSSAIDDVGQLLSLPVGARVCDTITELNQQIGADLDVDIADSGSVLRNGRVAKAEEYVGNGDVLLITL